jgi:hypothetical protein
MVEVQGTGESGSFTRAQLNTLLDLAEAGIDQLKAAQRAALGDRWRAETADSGENGLRNVEAIW